MELVLTHAVAVKLAELISKFILLQCLLEPTQWVRVDSTKDSTRKLPAAIA